MRHLPPLALSLMLVATPALAAPAASFQNVASAITGVTVYPDRAQVTRTASLNLPAGTHTLRFDRLPIQILADSVRVRGEGSTQAVIHGFDLRTAYLGQSPTQEVKNLENQLVALDDQLRSVADKRQVHERQLNILKMTASDLGENLAKQVGAAKAKVEEWQKLLAFLQTQQDKEMNAIHNLDKQKRQLQNKKTAINVELGKLRGFRQEQVYQVPVTVEMKRAGTLELELEYVIPNARWSPAYDARLSTDGKKLDWQYYGVISQQTGEDWSNVKLRLSTARPAEGSRPPQLSSWFISPYQRYRPAPGRADNIMPRASRAPAEAAAGAYEEADAPAPEPIVAQQPIARIVDQGTSVTLEVPKAVSIPSDGEPHQTAVTTIHMEANPAYKVVPRLSPHAFLEVSTKHPGQTPILPGPVKAFVGHDYVGTTPLAEDVAPGAEFTVPMGVDRSVQVRRQRLEKRHGEEGLISKNQVTQYRYEIALTNFKTAAQTLTVLEAVPQTTDERIKVILNEANHPAEGQRTPGQVSWKFNLAPYEKKTLKWGYKVEYPIGIDLSGLE